MVKSHSVEQYHYPNRLKRISHVIYDFNEVCIQNKRIENFLTFGQLGDKLCWLCKGLSTLDKPDQIQFEHINTECTFAQSRLIPFHFQRWFRLDWTGSRNCALHIRTKKAWHACSCQLPTVSALLWATLCVPRICSTWEAIWWLAEVKIWRLRHGSYVEVWPLEVNMHTWIRFRTMQCRRNRCTLDSHWIRIGQFGYWITLNPDSVWTGLNVLR